MSCYSYYYGYYDCNNGLSYGARIGIGVGIAVGVVLLIAACSYWRRRNLRNQFRKYRPPTLPTNNTNTNPYANNPPPPAPGWQNNNSTFAGNPYGNNPAPPQAAYQPSMAGQYGAGARTGPESANANQHEHGYEWEQAREAERLEREGGEAAPPGYDVAANQTGNTTYAPPPGAPPNKRTTSGVV